MRSLLRPSAPPRPAFLLLLLAAIPFGLAGLEHAKLVHQGFWETGPVGVLFVLNAIGTGVGLVLFALGRVRLFVLAVLAISIGSIIGIVLSHSGIGFGRLREGEWNDDAKLSLILEIVATVLAVGGILAGGLRDVATDAVRVGNPVRLVAAGVLAVVFALATAGVATGSPQEQPQLTAAQLTASKDRLAQGGEQVKEGEEEFEEEGCSSCHTMQASGYHGKLGPRLDVAMAGAPAEAVVGATLQRKEKSLMRLDYAKRIDQDEMAKIAAYVVAVAGPTPLEGGEEGGGKGGPPDDDGDEG